MMYLYTATVRRDGVPTLVPKAQLVGLYGFQSVFGYPEHTAAIIRRQGNTRGLQQAQLFSDEILVDFDDAPVDAKQFGEYLIEQNIPHRIYDSGNRSIHYHVDMRPQISRTLARDTRLWIQQYAPGADQSIYTPTGLFRLPGTWHEKNPGHRKVLIGEHGGEPLVLPQAPRKVIQRVQSHTGIAEAKFFRGLGKRQQAGGRRCYVWYLGKKAADSGMDAGDALEYIVSWNMKHCNPPLDIDDLVTKVREAYDE
jgi:hypothetical protein